MINPHTKQGALSASSCSLLWCGGKIILMIKIGAHVSTSGGIQNAFENAEKIGAKAIQIFGSSPQQWVTRAPSELQIKSFLKKKTSLSMPVFLHAGYLVNLASPKPELREKSVRSLSEHFQIAQALEAEGLIFHLGSSGDAGTEAGIKHLVSGIKEVLKNIPGPARLLLENSAGGGNKLGSTLEQLSEIFSGVASDRAKICFDTAHAFEAGIIKYESATEVKSFFDSLDKKIGLENIGAIHANDSKTEFDSAHDRHENIGKGLIGKKGFANLAKEKRLHDKTWLLEVPGLDDLGPDAANITALASYF